VGIEEQSENRISFFPNPTSSVINITGISSWTNVQLYDFTMRLLHHEVIPNNASLDLSTMAPGTYLLRITNDEIDVIEKLIVQ
jgi:hypothetical protein